MTEEEDRGPPTCRSVSMARLAMSEYTPPLLTLPNELLMQILFALPVDALFYASLTCKHLYFVAHDTCLPATKRRVLRARSPNLFALWANHEVWKGIRARSLRKALEKGECGREEQKSTQTPKDKA